MAWAYFQNQEAFHNYHNAVCTDLGIPLPGRITDTNEPAIMEQWTDAWVDPVQIKDQGNVSTWVAHIPDSHILEYDHVLGIVINDSQVVFNSDGTVTVSGIHPQPQTYIIENLSFNHRRPKPPTYEMDGDVYDTETGEIIS